MENLNEAKQALSTSINVLLHGKGMGKMYYAHFLMRMNVKWTDSVPTAGVSVTERVNLYINPTFFLSLDELERVELLIHEIEHVVFLHPIRQKEHITEGMNKNTASLFNIATDANINERLPHITRRFGVTIDRVNKQLEEMKSKDRLNNEDIAEVHYEILRRNQKDEQGYSGANGEEGDMDSHETWAETIQNEELVKAVVSQVANDAKNATGAGNTPNHLLRQINSLGSSKVNWKSQLRQFFANAQRYSKENTRSRRNRRYGILQAGKKRKPHLHVAICVDSSGSVGDESFAQFFSEIASIHKNNVRITILDADSEVAGIYEYDPKKPIERLGNGGTCYSPAINKAKDMGVDGIIYFGDFDTSDKPENPKVPFLWVGVNTAQKAPAEFGKVVYVDSQTYKK